MIASLLQLLMWLAVGAMFLSATYICDFHPIKERYSVFRKLSVFNKFALLFLLASFTLRGGSKSGTGSGGSNNGNDDDNLATPRKVVGNPTDKDCPVLVATNHCDEGYKTVDFKKVDHTLWFSYGFSRNFTTAHDILDVIATHELPFTNGVMIAKVFLWPDIYGVAFELDDDEVRDVYTNKVAVEKIDALFLQALPHIDTDKDGYSDAEEELVTKTDLNIFDYEEDPPFPKPYYVETTNTVENVTRALPVSEITGKPIVHQAQGSGSFIPTVSGYYELCCSADDYIEYSVGPLSATSLWANHQANPGYAYGWLEAGVEYSTSFYFEDYGNGFWYTNTITEVTSGTTNCLPSLVVSPTEIKVSKVTLIEESPSVTIADRCTEHECSVRTNIVDSATVEDTWYKKVEYTLVHDGRDMCTIPCFYTYEDDKPQTNQCNQCCTEGFTPTNGCVEISQKFGRTPNIPSMPFGRLVVRETTPTTRLASNAALKYDHPRMREILRLNGYNATIRNGLGETIEYVDGKPSGYSAGLNCAFYHDGTNYIERIDSDLEVIYENKKAAYLKTTYSNRIPVSELGIDVEKDSSGNITSITSAADGTITYVPGVSPAWSLEWRSPSGAFVKSFTFTGNGYDNISLEEYRNEEFTFHYHWQYDSSINDWRYEKGDGSEKLLSKKEMQYDADNHVWNIVESCLDQSSNVVTSTSSVLDAGARSKQITEKKVGEKYLYSATRDEHGFIRTETNEKGGTTVYSRDNFGRIISKIEPYADTHTKTTLYSYLPGSRHRYDTRPIRKIVKLDGTTILHEEYEYAANRKDTYRAFDLDVRHSFIEYDDYGREVLNVKENGRATRTTYDGLNEVREEGVYDDGFMLVDGKSTRTELYKSAAGNVTNQVEYAYVDNAWRETKSKAMTYDAAHRVTSTTYSNGKTSAAEYICTGPIWTRDEEGIVTSKEYNSVKALKKSTRFGPHGAVETSYTYDGAGRVIMETRSAEDCPTETHTYTYDNRGRIVSETGFDGKMITTTYSGDDKVTTRTFADGGTEVTTVASNGRLLSITGTAVIPEYYTYGVTPFGETWTRVDYGMEDSPKYEITYKNAYGEDVRIKRSGFGREIVSRLKYNNRGQLIEEREDGKPTKTYEYDVWGERTMTIESADGVARYTQNTNGYEMSGDEVYSVRSNSVSADGIAAMMTTNRVQDSNLSLDTESARESIDKYGKYRRLLSVFDPTNSTRYVVSSYESVSNNAYQVVVDGLVTESISESAVTNRFEYNAYGWRTAAVDGRGNRTIYEYDERGNLIRAIDAAGGVKSYSYDAMNRKIAETNEVGNVKLFEYDTLGRTVYEGGGTYPVRYGFDQYGNQITMTTYRSETAAEGDTTTWDYDVASGLVTQKRYADHHGPTYNYTRDGKLSSRTWARGVTTYYAYDGFGNLTSITYNDGTPPITFTYDALGRITSITDVTGTTTITYNVYGDEVQVETTGLYAKTLVREYDAFGRGIGHTLDNTPKNNIEYDSATGRIRRVQLGGAWYAWGYLPGTDLKSSLSIGTAGTTTWEYEQTRDLLTSVTHHFFDSDISTYTYANDAAGRRTSKNYEVYGYNERDELTSVTTNSVSTYSYNYDDIGNRVSSSELGEARTYAANSLNQYVGADYDLDGNQTNIVTSTGIWAVTYNAENRPVNWQCGVTNIVMKYDYMGRRVEYLETVTIEGVAANNVSASVVTNAHHKFVYDGYLQLQRLNGSDNSVYLAFEWDPTEPVATRPLFMQQRNPGGNSSNYFFTHDGTKNVSDVVSYQRACGVVAHYDYAPFGAVTSATGSLSSINPFRFSSEYHDDTLGLVYYNYRPYNPLDGRWINADLIEELGGFNLVGYVNNNPIDYMDYAGLDIVDDYIKQLGDVSDSVINSNCRFILSYDIKRSNDEKFNTESVANRVRSRLGQLFPNNETLMLDSFSAESFIQSINKEKCICGVIYIGHVSLPSEDRSSRMIFTDTDSLVAGDETSDERITRHGAEEIMGDNFLQDGVSIIIGCNSAVSLGSKISIAEKISKVAHIRVLGTDKKVNFINGDVRARMWPFVKVNLIDFDNRLR